MFWLANIIKPRVTPRHLWCLLLFLILFLLFHFFLRFYITQYHTFCAWRIKFDSFTRIHWLQWIYLRPAGAWWHLGFFMSVLESYLLSWNRWGATNFSRVSNPLSPWMAVVAVLHRCSVPFVNWPKLFQGRTSLVKVFWPQIVVVWRFRCPRSGPGQTRAVRALNGIITTVLFARINLNSGIFSFFHELQMEFISFVLLLYFSEQLDKSVLAKRKLWTSWPDQLWLERKWHWTSN